MTSMRENAEHDPRLIWMDLETTGLVPAEGVILEIGVVITDLELAETARKSWVVPHDRAQILHMMDDYVLKMHLSSGLLEEVWADKTGFKATQKNRDNIELAIRNFIITETMGQNGKDRFLCGSSVGGFDMQWLKKHASSILDTMSYRVGDVSAFKVFFPGMLESSGDPAHRALADLDFSINQLRQMRDQLGLGAVCP